MTQPAVQVEGLSFTYPGRAAPSLIDLHFELPPGSWTVVAGGTGSGKSTLLRALAGLIPHHSAGEMHGAVRLFGQDTRDASPAALPHLAGLVLQAPDDQICTSRVESEVAFGLENLATPVDEIGRRVTESLGSLGIAELHDRNVAELSGGQKQRLILASILALAPRVLLLDEPLSQLDPQAAADLLSELDRLRAAGTTLVIVEHRLADVLPQADRVLVLDEGRLTFAGPRDAEELLSALESAQLELPEIPRLARRLGRPPAWTAAALASQFDERIKRTDHNADAAHKAQPTCTSDTRPLLLSVAGLSFRYRSAAVPLWSEVEFQLRLGERLAVIGANGSGKSTLFATLAGLLRPASGKIELAPPIDGRYPLGLVLQQPDLMLFCRSVREELSYGPRQLGLPAALTAERVERVARQLDLDALLDEPPQALSQGQRLRVAVAATLTLAPSVLALDEPTTGLDPRQIDRLMKGVDPNERDVGDGLEGDREPLCGGLIFSTHDLRTVVRFADRVLVLAEGKVLADCSPTELLADEALLAAAAQRRTELFELRQAFGLSGVDVETLAEELAL